MQGDQIGCRGTSPAFSRTEFLEGQRAPGARRGHGVVGPCRPGAGSARILILSSGMGAGHARAAQAIEAAIRLECPSASVSLLDWWALMDPRVAQGAKSIYLQLVQAHPDLYERIYRLGDETCREMVNGLVTLPAAMRDLFAIVHDL